jgi:putative flippase GtrA
MTIRAGAGRRWLKFQAVGVAGTLVQLATLMLLREGLGLSVAAATALAVEISILHNFCWHRRWTWTLRGSGLSPRPLVRQLAEYNLVYGAVSLPSNVLLTQLYMPFMRGHYLIANLLAIGTVGVVNFLAGELVIFRPMVRKGTMTETSQ